MDSMDLTLEYFFIYNPTLVPDNPKPSEVEMMDAKKIFFYPTLIDINKQRNLVGMGEGFFAFFNIFKNEVGTAKEPETQVVALNNRIIISKCIDNENFIVLIMTHGFGTDKISKYRSINRMSRLNLAIYKQLMNRFCKVYRMIFEPVQYYISSQGNLVEFTENILRFVESYFFMEQAHKKPNKCLITMAKLFGDLVMKRKMSNDLVMHIARTIIELKNDYDNFYDIMAFKSSYLIYSTLEDEVIRTVVSLLFDLDVNTSRSMDSRSRIIFSSFFEKFYDFEFLDTLNKPDYVISQTRNQKNFSFNLPVTAGDETKYFKFYATFIVDKDMLILLFMKNKSTVPALINRVKNIPKVFNSPFSDQPKSKNLYFGFFNIFNQYMTNAVDITGAEKMNKGLLLFFVSQFFNKQDANQREGVYSYYMMVGDEALIFNLINGRITWIYSSDVEKYDVFDEFYLLKESIKTIII